LLRKRVPIISNISVAPGIYDLAVKDVETAASAMPGQFCHFRVLPAVTDSYDPLLRRPLSINDAEMGGGVKFTYAVVGRGTEALSRMKPGDIIDYIGPLGNGFDLSVDSEAPLLAGGGMGAVPLVLLARRLIESGRKPAVALGFSSRDRMICCDQLRNLGCDPRVVTEDGSAGAKGLLVGDYLQEFVEREKPDYVYACGPGSMLAALAGFCRRLGIPGQVSLEERMACGIGACLSCSCSLRDTDSDQVVQARVCRDGPVFDISRVVF